MILFYYSTLHFGNEMQHKLTLNIRKLKGQLNMNNIEKKQVTMETRQTKKTSKIKKHRKIKRWTIRTAPKQREWNWRVFFYCTIDMLNLSTQYIVEILFYIQCTCNFISTNCHDKNEILLKVAINIITIMPFISPITSKARVTQWVR